jgi:hypothetical protein
MSKCLICKKPLKKVWYVYKISEKEIELCEQCEMDLFAEMMAQFIVETKFSMDIPCVAKRVMSKEELLK